MFGTSNNFKANVQQCTREQFNAVLDSAEVAAICQVITDDLQKCKAGELSQEEFDAVCAVSVSCCMDAVHIGNFDDSAHFFKCKLV